MTKTEAQSLAGIRPKGKFGGGGRKPGSQNKRTKTALEVCENLGFHPAAFLAMIALTGYMPSREDDIDPETKKPRLIAVDAKDRIDAAKALCPYLMPKLAQTQLTGPNEGPIKFAALDITEIMKNPDLLASAQKLSLAMSEQPLLTAAEPVESDDDNAPE